MMLDAGSKGYRVIVMVVESSFIVFPKFSHLVCCVQNTLSSIKVCVFFV